MQPYKGARDCHSVKANERLVNDIEAAKGCRCYWTRSLILP